MDARTIALKQQRASERLVALSQAVAGRIDVPGHILSAVQTQRGTPLERQTLQLEAACDLLETAINHLEAGVDDGES